MTEANSWRPERAHGGSSGPGLRQEKTEVSAQRQAERANSPFCLLWFYSGVEYIG